jgi:hypothetical protein
MQMQALAATSSSSPWAQPLVKSDASVDGT